jgi:hypothetical protein
MWSGSLSFANSAGSGFESLMAHEVARLVPTPAVGSQEAAPRCTTPPR